MCQRRLSVALVIDAHTQEINNNEVQKNDQSSGQRSIKSEQVLGSLFIVKTDDLQDDEESVTKT